MSDVVIADFDLFAILCAFVSLWPKFSPQRLKDAMEREGFPFLVLTFYF
jgi:hypothetical protein